MDQNDHGIDYNSIPLPEEPTAPRQTKRTQKQAAEGTPVASTSGGETAPIKQRLTIELLEKELKARGYIVRYNILKKRTEITKYAAKKRERLPLDSFVTSLHSAIGGMYTNAGFPSIERYIDKIAADHEYNPVIEYFENVKWDGKQRISEVFQILRIPDNDFLSRALIKKWLLQTAAMPYNQVPVLDDKHAVQAYGAEGVLTLQGEQGAGKTSFFRKLALHWFEEGARLDDFDKDLRRRAITAWITELGEVESTFKKSSVENLKSFITQSIDRFRLPYGRADIEGARITSMCATCNGTGFLADTTGNRRWFIIPLVSKIDLDALENLDVEQLWAEYFEQVRKMTQKQRAACFRLSSEERIALDKRNGGYMKPVPAQEDIKLLLEEATDNPCYTWKLFTAGQWWEEYDFLRKYSPVQIGVALKALGYTAEHTKQGNFYTLPVKKYGIIPLPVAETKEN